MINELPVWGRQLVKCPWIGWSDIRKVLADLPCFLLNAGGVEVHGADHQ